MRIRMALIPMTTSRSMTVNYPDLRLRGIVMPPLRVVAAGPPIFVVQVEARASVVLVELSSNQLISEVLVEISPMQLMSEILVI